MKFNKIFCYCVFIIVVSISNSSCSKKVIGDSSNSNTSISSNQNPSSNTVGLTIDERRVAEAAEQASKNGGQAVTVSISDGSKLTTSFDGVGNKTVIRKFDNHPNISYLRVSSSPSGVTVIDVFGYDGVIKKMPSELASKMLYGGASEIVSVTGITNVRTPREQPTQQKSIPLPPGVKFPPMPKAGTTPQINETQQEPVEDEGSSDQKINPQATPTQKP